MNRAQKLVEGLRMTRLQSHAIILLISALALSLIATDRAVAVERDELARALKSTVLVLTLDNSFDVIANGSGSILDSQRGLILTNFHVVGDDEAGTLYNDDGLVVIGVMPPDLKGAPILKYVGKMIQGDAELDLAVVEIVALLDDPDAPLPNNLGLTEVPTGDSDAMMIGDEMSMLGYPGLGGATVTFTQGVVSGFLDDDNNSIYEWIKTDTEVNPGNSGGLAINAAGEFIGVPTIAISGIDVTGKLSLIRSGNVALDFFNGGTLTTSTGSGASIGTVQFGEAINRRNMIPNPATAFPAETTDLYASYTYEGFTDGGSFKTNWYVNGELAAEDEYIWDGGASGVGFALVYNDEGLGDGYFEVEFVYAGESLYRGGVAVGDATPVASVGGFGEIVFSSAIDADNQPLDAASEFADVATIYGSFSYQGMANGMPWATKWYYEGQEVTGGDTTWNAGESGQYAVSLNNGGDSLPVGAYTLELYLAGSVVRVAEFVVTDRPQRVQQIDVIGYALDRDNTRKVISGVLVIFLKPGTTIDEWVEAEFSDEMVHASAETQRDGLYQLSAEVLPGQSYGVVAIHDDYEAITVDGYEIPTDAEDPYQLDIKMTRE